MNTQSFHNGIQLQICCHLRRPLRQPLPLLFVCDGSDVLKLTLNICELENLSEGSGQVADPGDPSPLPFRDSAAFLGGGGVEWAHSRGAPGLPKCT